MTDADADAGGIAPATEAGEPSERTATLHGILDSGEAIREEQVARALEELDDDLSREEREAIERLAERLVARLLAVPVGTLAGASEADVETARTLFGD